MCFWQIVRKSPRILRFFAIFFRVGHEQVLYRKLTLQQKCKKDKPILSFVTRCRSTVPNLKQILMQKWHLIQQQPLLSEVFKDPPIVCYKRGRSLKLYSIEPNCKISGYYTTWIGVVYARHPHYYYPCFPKTPKCLFVGGMFPAKVIFVVENARFLSPFLSDVHIWRTLSQWFCPFNVASIIC